MTGGYKIIDLQGLDLANIQLDSTKIEKIFNDIESTYKTKALLFDNYKINGIEQNATFSSAIVKNSGFEITLGDYKVLIKNDSIEDTTLHLYKHQITITGTDDYDNTFNIFINDVSTNNTVINTKELLINIFGDGSRLDYYGCVGYTGNNGVYPIIYEVFLDLNNSFIYYNDSEEIIKTITNISDIVTQKF